MRVSRMFEHVKRPSELDLEYILQIVDDCEAFQLGNDSPWSKEQEKVIAYNNIVEYLRKENR